MIKNFVNYALQDPTKGTIEETVQTRNSLLLTYPCEDPHVCTPYILEISKGIYRFECCGSKGGISAHNPKPGLGGYTAGALLIQRPTKLFVYIGNVGFFNAVKGMESDVAGISPGGATDVRLNFSDHWWDDLSLISRIMVSSGGGGAEWASSIGGNGGGIIGGSSTSAKNANTPDVYEDLCPGANQTSGSNCSSYIYYVNNNPTEMTAAPGSFGSAGIPQPFGGNDYGGFGGGGYYGGTSYQTAFAGSGGSSFISGHKGCNAVKEQIESIEHTGQPFHYSGFVFQDTKMISGNESMPLPNSPTGSGIHSGEGAFRITLIEYRCNCINKKDHSFLFFFFMTFICFS